MERIKALFEAIRIYLREVISEMRKVTWPNRDRTIKLSGIVVAMVVLFAAFLFVWDSVLGVGAQKLLGSK